MVVKRNADGTLPSMRFLKGKKGKLLAERNIGWTWDEETRAIEQTRADNGDNVNIQGHIYDLSGKPLKEIGRQGMYIVNGNKIIVR
jgi:hypothetical protein